jgi:mRNA interferase HigB
MLRCDKGLISALNFSSQNEIIIKVLCDFYEMHIISRRRLVQFSEIHADAETPLDIWYRATKAASWKNLVELKESFPSADLVGIFTVFNIKGNHYRLIAEINYRSGTVFVRHILTHANYDKGKWKL